MGPGLSKPKPVSSSAASGKPYACNGTDYVWMDAPTNSRYVTVNGRRITCLSKCNSADQYVVVNNAITGQMRSADGSVYTSTQYYPCQRNPTDPLCPKIDISCKVNTAAAPGVNIPTLNVR